MKFLSLATLIIEKLMKLSQKQSVYMENLYSILLNKQIEKINRKSNVK